MKYEFNPDEMPAWLRTIWPPEKLPTNIIAGINEDDCGIIRFGKQCLVITTDYINAWPIATELKLGSFETLGRLLVATNIADLLGTCAHPIAFMTAVSMKRDTRRKDIEMLYKGIRTETQKYSIPVIGGDTKLNEANAMLGIAIGIADSEDQLAIKSRGVVGDSIWVSGFIGSCNAAVIGLTQNINTSESWKRWAKRVICRPHLPFRKVIRATQLRAIHAGADISDGLGADLAHLCKASNVGAVINAKDIPIAPEAAYIADTVGLPRWSLPFGIGGDFQVIFTGQSEADAKMAGLGFIRLGYLTEPGEMRLQLGKDRSVVLPKEGHLDYRNMKFTEQVNFLLKEASNAQ